jgi:hypothetical protein
MVDWLNFIKVRGKHEIFSMFGYREKLGQFYIGPMFGVEKKSLVISNLIYKKLQWCLFVCMCGQNFRFQEMRGSSV